MKQKREREEACSICGHYHDYEGGEPCSICGHRLVTVEEKPQAVPAYPSEIIPGLLYLGSYDHASRVELLKALGVTHILNTVPTCQVLYKNSFVYHTVSESPPPFEECFEFLERVRKENGKKVLVHCMSGLSRSPTVVVGYLMGLRKWGLTESYKWVKDRHPATKLVEADARRLQQLEYQSLGRSSSDFEATLATYHPIAGRGASPFSWGSANQPAGGFRSPASQQPEAAASPLQFPQLQPSPNPQAFNFLAGQASGPFVFGSGSSPAAAGGAIASPSTMEC